MKKLIIITITSILLTSTAYAVDQNRLPASIGNMVLQIISLQEQNDQANENLRAAYAFIMKQYESGAIKQEDIGEIKDPNFIKLLKNR